MMAKPLRFALVSILGLLGLAGCPGPGNNPDAGPMGDAAREGPYVELGAGRSGFEPVHDGDALELVAGPQGGWHVFLAVRAHGIAVDGSRLYYELREIDSGDIVTRPATYAVRSSSVEQDGDTWSRAGDRAIFNISDPAEVVGERFEVEVELEAPSGMRYRETRTAMVVDER